jgi:hypothetical protein
MVLLASSLVGFALGALLLSLGLLWRRASLLALGLIVLLVLNGALLLTAWQSGDSLSPRVAPSAPWRAK